MGEVLFVDLESGRHSPLDVRTTAEVVVRRRLLAVPGVSQVIATGGEQKQYEVLVDPARLSAHGVSSQEVAAALTAANQNATAGFRSPRGRSTWCGPWDAWATCRHRHCAREDHEHGAGVGP
jgi:Cu/Ag efflux pump CusA